MAKEVKNYGEAYAFFNCSAPLNEVNQVIVQSGASFPRGIPNKLELTLCEMPTFKQECNDPDLLQFVDSETTYPIFHSKARKLKEQATRLRVKDYRYALAVRYNGGTNDQAGDVAGNIIIDIYSCFNDNMFLGDIVGKGPDGEYCLWEED